MSLSHHGTEQKLYDHHSAGLITSRTSKFYLYVTVDQAADNSCFFARPCKCFMSWISDTVQLVLLSCWTCVKEEQQKISSHTLNNLLCHSTRMIYFCLCMCGTVNCLTVYLSHPIFLLHFWWHAVISEVYLSPFNGTCVNKDILLKVWATFVPQFTWDISWELLTVIPRKHADIYY